MRDAVQFFSQVPFIHRPEIRCLAEIIHKRSNGGPDIILVPAAAGNIPHPIAPGDQITPPFLGFFFRRGAIGITARRKLPAIHAFIAQAKRVPQFMQKIFGQIMAATIVIPAQNDERGFPDFRKFGARSRALSVKDHQLIDAFKLG